MSNLFSIECETCHARLSVKDHSAIGQILACPKCGSMVQVQAPAGYKLPPEDASSDISQSKFAGEQASSESNEAAIQNAADAATADASAFDDIDSLLDSKTAPKKPRSDQQHANQQGSPAAPPRVNPPPVDSQGGRWKGASKVSASSQESRSQSAPDEPIVPGDDWTSPQAKARQKMLLVYGGSAIGILIALGMIAMLLAQMFSKHDSVAVAQKDNQQQADDGPIEESAETTDKEADDGRESEKDATDLEDDDLDDVDPKDESKESENQAENGTAPKEIVPDVIATSTDDETPPSTSMIPDSEEDAPPGFVKPRPPSLDRGEDVGVGAGAVADLMKLTEFLEGSALDEAIEGGMSDPGLVGEFSVDTNYIRKPRPIERINIGRNLSQQIGLINFNDKSINEIIAFLESISSVPVTIHSDAITESGFDLSKKITLRKESTSALELLKQIFEPAGLVVETGKHGVVVRRKIDFKIASADYDISALKPSESDVDHERMMKQIVLLFVDPTSWESETPDGISGAVPREIAGDLPDTGKPGKIKSSPGRLSITQTAANHAKIKSLFQTLAYATKSPPKSDAPTPRHLAAIDGLSVDSEVEFIQADHLRDLRAELDRIHGVSILIDWESIYQEGWNLKTLVPFGGPDKSLFESFDGMLRSMKLSMVGYDAKTFLVTTPQVAARNLSTEIYLLGDVVTDKASAEKLAGQIQKVVAGELMTNKEASYFVAKADQYYLLARVSQDRQIKIERYLKSIREALASTDSDIDLSLDK